MSKKFEMFSPNVASEEFVQKSIFLEYLESDERRMCVLKLVSTCLKGVFTSNQSCAWFALGGISYSKHCHSAWYSLLELSSSCKEASLLALLSFPNNFLFYSFLFFFPCLIWHCLAEGLADIFCGQCGLCQFLCHVWQSEFLWKFLWQIILLACHKKKRNMQFKLLDRFSFTRNLGYFLVGQLHANSNVIKWINLVFNSDWNTVSVSYFGCEFNSRVG